MFRKISTETKFLAIFMVLAGITYTGVRLYADSVRVDFKDIQARAKKLAALPYKPQPARVPDFLLKLTYDQLRDIRFKPEAALWKDGNLPFQVQFFHPGFIFNKTIQVHEIDARGTHPVPFTDQFFNYGQNKIPEPIPVNMGFSGFRVHYPLNRPDYLDELIVFQGASYFRALAQNQHYGISARGVAINSGESVPEEFPTFEEFWMEKPKTNSTALTIYALMNSPSVTGAYEFIIHPGKETVVEVQADLFFRDAVKTLGIAPLTSMFWYGENSGTTYGDFRPEVHDSDGILSYTGAGEWLWRPLATDKKIQVSCFEDNNPRGFGLLQRDRDFHHYEDLEAFYHLRPSVWVEPKGQWGKGQVRLIELPTSDETNDNIVAFWVPDQAPKAGQEMNLAYTLHWMMDESPMLKVLGQVQSTRIGRVPQDPSLRKFVIDFSGDALNKLGPEHALDNVALVEGGASLKEETVQKNPLDGSWRVVLTIKLEGKGSPVEMRCFLKEGTTILTETWTYLYNP